MKIRNKDLKKAYSMVKAKRYPQAIRFLEPKVPLFLEDEIFYYFLGVSCFHTGDLGGSEFYLKRSLQVNHNNIDSRLYLAAIQLKKRDQANAARLWLNILDIDPGNKIAQRGLNRLKRIKNPSEYDHYVNSKEINKLLAPVKGIPPNIVRSLFILMGTVMISVVFYFVYPYLIPDKSEREDIASLSLENYIGPLLEFEGDFTYEMTGTEIKDLFESAVSDFHNFDDNSLQMKINKINLSNASNDLKGKISILEKLIQKPTFITMKTNFNYRDIMRDPLLYNNCFVLWRGKVTNVSVDTDKISLDFLIGYENETVLQGIIYTEIPFEVSINQTIPIEILGQIKNRNGKIILFANSVRPIIN